MSRSRKIIIYSIFGALFVAGLLVYNFTRATSCIITIQSNGKVIKKIDIGSVSETYEFDVKHNGTNTIRVSKDKIEVIEADCPDKICIEQSKNGIFPVVCLPHQLVINTERTVK